METQFVSKKERFQDVQPHRRRTWLSEQALDSRSDVGTYLLTRRVTFFDNLSRCDSMTVSYISK